MRWFEGQIASGIAQAKRLNSLFVVYIRGTNEDSEKMDKTWEEEEVSKNCENAGLVVMRFQADSPECQQFSVYYPVICVPCVYLISGNTGMLLESIGGFASASDLIQKIKTVGEQLPTASATQSQPVAAAQPKPPVQPQATSPVLASTTPEVQASPASTASSSSEKESARERAARMRQKMEEVHRKKEQQRKEAEKQKEMERRKVGQDVQKSDKMRSDQQARQLADDIRKERMEDKMAREKVLQQLARDKAEKQARFQSEKEKREQQKVQAQKEKEAAETAEQSRKQATQLETARIQFRLPDGSTMTSQFASTAPLQEALDFVTENVAAIMPEFTMSTTYPRRNFGPNDMQTPFCDLQLVPRAAIVILPGRLTPTTGPAKSQVSASTDGGVFSWFLAPFLFIYNLIYNIIFGTPQASPAASSPSSTPPSQSAGTEDSSAERLSRNAGARPKSSYARRRTPASGGNADTFSRRDGNVHRLNNQQNDDDENNTWNGNSTQQM